MSLENYEGFPLKVVRTKRGFCVAKFEDHYGAKCSLQTSSLAFENAIWLGVNDPNPEIMASHAPEEWCNGQTTGWIDVPLPEKTHIRGRMHLTQEMVIEMLPLLEHFAQTGKLPID